MCAVHWCRSPGFRRTIGTGVADRQTGQGITDRIKRRQRDRGEKQYLAPRAQQRQQETNRSRHFSANSGHVARR